MAREFRSLLVFLASLAVVAVSSVAYAVGDAVRFVRDVVTFDWKLDAHTSIALNSVMHEAGRSPSTALQRAKAFLQRALSHPWWISDHFDPGRSAAPTA